MFKKGDSETQVGTLGETADYFLTSANCIPIELKIYTFNISLSGICTLFSIKNNNFPLFFLGNVI